MLLILSPLPASKLIERGNRAQFNDSLSRSTKGNLDALVDLRKNELKLTKIIERKDSIIKTKVENELAYLTQCIGKKRT